MGLFAIIYKIINKVINRDTNHMNIYSAQNLISYQAGIISCTHNISSFLYGILCKIIPLASTISLSIPLGPSVVRTASAIAPHAFILLTICGTPWEESVPSFNNIICGCCNVEDKKN